MFCLRFVIGPQDGVITTNCNSSALDRERLDVYYLSVTATDGKTEDRLKSNSLSYYNSEVFIISSWLTGKCLKCLF